LGNTGTEGGCLILIGHFFRELAALGSHFLLGFIIIFIVNLFVLRFAFIFRQKKQIGKAAIVFVIMLLINIIFVSISGKENLSAHEPNEKAGTTLTSKAPPKTYPFIRNHFIERDASTGAICAVDNDGVKVTLSRENPRQIYQDSFATIMGKENYTFPDKNKALEYARFVVLMYYQESAPFYPNSVGQLGDYLQLRHNPDLKRIGLLIANASEKKDKTNDNFYTLYGEEWDVDGNVMNFKNPNAIKVLKSISPPRFAKDGEGALQFRFFTFSSRYHELVEWQFRVFKNGEIWVKKLNELKSS
jgi:hypothetical protein